MNVVLKKLREIQARPSLYLAQPTLAHLKSFIDGYALREYELNGNSDCAILDGFQKYVEQKFGEKLAISWACIISKNSESESKAFATFFKLLEEYLRNSPQWADPEKYN